MSREIKKYSHTTAIEQWIRIPIDEVGYLNSKDLMLLDDESLKTLIKKTEVERYHSLKWRNYRDLWKRTLGHYDTKYKTIFDFGCGIGIESLQFAKLTNKIIIGDIVQSNIDLAERVLNIHGYPCTKVLTSPAYPYFPDDITFDVFYANGVLHHTPEASSILAKVNKQLNQDGEVRLLLYSDKGFYWATGYKPNSLDPAVDAAYYKEFVCRFDGVGYYADWYNVEKIIKNWGDLFKIKNFNYITKKNGFFGQYCTVILESKNNMI